ncbi:MAG: hypothetical protein H7Y89_17370 [Steroidobacteraceae bacterium]|nr:hypothetical protein [Steroidobacteraceae bacterium]
MFKSVFLATLCCLSGPALADSPAPADCGAVPALKSKSRPTFESNVLMTSLLFLQGQGEAEFTPKYSKPASECVLDRFDVAGLPVVAIYSPFERGEGTLHYRFVAGSETGAREVLVIYDGVTAAMAKKGEVFKVVEDRAGKISYYGLFRDQPTYATLKPLITGILDGSAMPLATVRWPKGEKEPVIDAYDTKRLK